MKCWMIWKYGCPAYKMIYAMSNPRRGNCSWYFFGTKWRRESYEKKKKITTKKKEKTKKQLLEEEYKKNPAKRGTFDPVNQVWVINVQLVEILDLQLKKLSLGEIAKQMKMSKPALIEFMDEKGYVLEDNKFIQRKLAKKIVADADIEEEIAITVELKPRVYDDRKENIEFTEDSFEDIQKDIQNMFNWYKKIKEHQIFESLKNSDMEK